MSSGLFTRGSPAVFVSECMLSGHEIPGSQLFSGTLEHSSQCWLVLSGFMAQSAHSPPGSQSVRSCVAWDALLNLPESPSPSFADAGVNWTCSVGVRRWLERGE